MKNQDSYEDKANSAKEVIHINTEIGLKYYDDSWDFYKEGIEMFVDRLQTLVNQRYSEHEKNHEQIKTSMHTLSSMAGYVGAVPLQALAKKIERSIENEQIAGLENLLEELDREMRQASFAAINILKN